MLRNTTPSQAAMWALALGAIAAGGLASLLPPPNHPWQMIWIPFFALGCGAFGYLGTFLLQRQGSRRADSAARQRQAAERGRELERVRRQLRVGQLAFRAEQLDQERQNLRRAVAGLSGRNPSFGPLLRLLAIEGPDSDAWLHLGRAALQLGRGSDALRCVAEAVRAGLTGVEALGEVADLSAGRDGPLPRRGAAGLVQAALQADSLPPEALGELYRRLLDWDGPFVLRALVLRELFARVPDREEQARQTEQLRAAPVVDDQLRQWLREAWSGYRLAGDWRMPAEPGEPAPPWVAMVPVTWRPLLGVETAGGAVVYDEPLPQYVTRQSGDLERIAASIEELRDDQAVDLRESSLQFRRRFGEALWPRAIRSRTAITQMLSLTVSRQEPELKAIGLEIIAAALAEESDPALLAMVNELEGLARSLPGQRQRVLGLQAAAAAQAPRDPARGERLREEAIDLWRRLAADEQIDLLPRLTSALTETIRRGRGGSRLVEEVATVAFAAGDPYAARTLLLTVGALPAGDARATFIGRLRERGLRLDSAGRLLLALLDHKLAEAVEAMTALWDRQLDDGPPIEQWWRYQQRDDPTAVAPFLIVHFSQPGDEPALRAAVDYLRQRGESGHTYAIAGWLVAAHRLDRLEDRPTRPEARRALNRLIGLAPVEASFPIHFGLRTTLTDTSRAWLDAVERVFLKRVGNPRLIDSQAWSLEVETAETVIADLQRAHAEAVVEEWLGRYSDAVGNWAEAASR